MGKGRGRAGLAAVAVVAAGVIPVIGGGTAGNAAVGDPIFPDFDTDGKADVVVSMDQEDIGAVVDAGAVGVFYGGPVGPFRPGSTATSSSRNATPASSTTPRPTAVSVTGGPRATTTATGSTTSRSNNFGATCSGATPACRPRAGAGMVHVLYGGVHGLSRAGYQAIDLDSTGVAENPGVGRPVRPRSLPRATSTATATTTSSSARRGATSGRQQRPGAVFGSSPGCAAGIDTTHDNCSAKGSTFQGDQADDNDIFGYAVTVGDFDNDGNDDIAIGVPDETLNDLVRRRRQRPRKSGTFHIVYGDSTCEQIAVHNCTSSPRSRAAR